VAPIAQHPAEGDEGIHVPGGSRRRQDDAQRLQDRRTLATRRSVASQRST
jgi:hypothetical protein